MIHYQLRCSHEHQFDGWFKDSAGFDQQAASGLVGCPECGDTKIERALMTPAVPRKGRRPTAPAEAAPAETSPAKAPSASTGPAAPPGTAIATRPGPGAAPVPAQLVAMLQRMRAEVEKNCDYVGEQFADEARKIHQGESDRRAIYGEATEEQAEALAEEGIDVSRIPWVPRADG